MGPLNFPGVNAKVDQSHNLELKNEIVSEAGLCLSTWLFSIPSGEKFYWWFIGLTKVSARHNLKYETPSATTLLCNYTLTDRAKY